MVDTTEEEPRRVRPFADFLAEHNRGQSAGKAALDLQTVVEAVKQTGKKGSVSVTVSVEPMKGNPDAMLTTITVVSKVPTDPPKAAVFYADEDGNLQRTDPGQLAFESLKEVEAPEVRDAPARPQVVGGDA